MQKYAIPTLILALVSVSVYAFNLDTDPRILIEKENREKILKCLEDVYTQTGSTNMIRKIKFCESLPLLEIWTHSTGSTVPPQWQEAVEIAKKKFAHAKLYQDVCKKQINSPLCKDRELFDRLYQLTEERIPNKNWFAIQLWILNSESSLGTNFYPSKCDYTNNLAWKKWRKTDSWESVRDQKIPDANWCWLYSFKSIEDFWISYTNTFKYWYAWCIDSKTPLSCIAPMYVKWDWKPKPQWVKNASIFLN